MFPNSCSVLASLLIVTLSALFVAFLCFVYVCSFRILISVVYVSQRISVLHVLLPFNWEIFFFGINCSSVWLIFIWTDRFFSGLQKMCLCHSQWGVGLATSLMLMAGAVLFSFV